MSSSTANKKSVLFVIYQTGVKGNGGVQSITNIIKEISADNSIYILTQMQTEFNIIWEKAGAKVIYRKPNKIHHLNILLHNLFLFFLLRKLKVNIVHCNDIQSLVCSFAGSFNKKMIFNMRAVKGPSDTYSRTWAFVLKYVDHTIVLSRDMMNRVQSHFPIVENKISYSYSVIDFDKFKSSKLEDDFYHKNNLNPDVNYIGVVGRFEDDKQQNLFLSKCVTKFDSEFRSKNHMLLIGDFKPSENPFAQECLEIIENNELEKFVTIINFQNNIQDWYNLFEVTVVPSKVEGLARCMIESLSCGTPVVSFDVSSSKEILLDNGCGVVVEQNDFEKLYKELDDLMCDDSKRLAYADKAEQTSRRLFCLKEVVQAYLDKY